MRRIRKMLLLFVSVLLLLSASRLSAFAQETAPITIIEEIDLPQDINFSVSNACSGHAYFMQAAADKSGSFLVYSRHVNPEDYSKVDYKKVHIDIYHSNGDFLQELTFTTPLDLAVDLEGNSVNIYFYSSVMVYDLITQEVHHYAIPEGAAVNEGLYKQLRREEFTAGNWVYRYEKGFDGYVKLIRSNGELVQILVEMPGTGNFWAKIVLPGGAIGLISIVTVLWQIKRKQLKK